MSERWYLRTQEDYGKKLGWQIKVLDELRIRCSRQKDVTKMTDGELALAAILAKMDVDVADWERTQAATNLEIARKDVETSHRVLSDRFKGEKS